MRAWQILSDGGIDALALSEVPDPQPGHGEVAIRVRASSINYRDLMTVKDPVPRNITYPRIPNSDGAGEVIAVGPGVADLVPGDRVAGCFFSNWRDGPCSAEIMASALGGARDGVLAEQIVLPAAGAIKFPAHLSFEEAATLPCAALTAWNALFEVGGVRAGDNVLLLGTGGVSVFALQFARIAGARVIITSSSDEKLDRATKLGAAETINYRQHPEWHEKVLECTEGIGADICVEVGGAGTLTRSLAATKVAGKVGLIGVLTGGTIDPVAVMRKSICLQGIYVGSRRMFENMNQAIELHELRPVISETYEFDQAKDAYWAMHKAGHFGKIVIRV